MHFTICSKRITGKVQTHSLAFSPQTSPLYVTSTQLCKIRQPAFPRSLETFPSPGCWLHLECCCLPSRQTAHRICCRPEGWAQMSSPGFHLRAEGEEEILCGNINLSFGSRPLGVRLPVWLFTRYMTLVKLFIFSKPQFPYLQNGGKKYLTWRAKWELNEMITKYLVKSDLQRMISLICESFPEFLPTMEIILPSHFHTRMCVCVSIICNTCACLPHVI